MDRFQSLRTLLVAYTRRIPRIMDRHQGTVYRSSKHIGLPIFLCTALLAGCAQGPGGPGVQGGGAPSAAETQLSTAMASQDPKQIAQAQMNLAAQMSGTQRSDLQMQAVETAVDAADFTLANNLLAQADTRAQWPAQAPRRAQLLSGFSQWQQGHAEQAFSTVNNLPLPLTPGEAQRRLFLMAVIDEASSHPIDAARQRAALDGMLTGPDAEKNRATLWNDLSSAPVDEIAQTVKTTSNPVFADWLGLALVYRTRPGELQSWIQNHPNHPAVTSGFATLLLGNASSMSIPAPTGTGPIIVLLPLTGDYQTIAKAISDGINFAHDRLGLAANNDIRIMDSGTTLASFAQALTTALAAQPSVIIGPLLKEQIPALNNIPGNAPPIIALNTPSDGIALPPGIISYSLSPDVDARATADQMIKDHKMTALVFAADNGLGHRISDAFSREYTLLGGQVLDSEYYDPTATDFSSQLRTLLQVHASSKGVFQPTIQTAAQGIFLGATSQQARMIVPQLDYFGADQLPRYGVGMIYNGTPNPLADQDKNGLVIPVEPILLAANAGPNDPMLGTYERANLSQLPRLFAFGSDALLIASDLKALLAHQTINGLTGALSLSLTGEIDRKPAWAQFKQGILQPLVGTDTRNLPSTILSPGSSDSSAPTQSQQSQAPVDLSPPSSPPPSTPATPVPTFTDGGGLAPAPVAH
ncbi:MAG TPA: penicillin-binding protein activator [Halothiobacillus sp.]|nr:penicillin-binding protein activator [Halothiobacillus sp.]